MQFSDNKRRGFALIVVLSTLSIITLLFAIASGRVINRLSETRTDLIVAETAFSRASLLTLAAKAFSNAELEDLTDVTIPVRWNGQDGLLKLQDVGGLIDLNTANPELLERFAALLNISDEQLMDYRRWRRTPLRLQRVSDFARVTGMGLKEAETLDSLSTVYSGRTGIAAELAPAALLEALSTGTDALAELPPHWSTPPSGSNFQVRIALEGGRELILGTIGIGQQGNARVLSSN